jgi:uncharacterized membrane protein
MKSKDFKQRAKDALSGNWFKAIIAAIIAMSCGAVGGFTVSINQELPTTPDDGSISALAGSLGQSVDIELIISLVAAILLGALSLLVLMFISIVVRIGYSQFNLDLVRSGDARIATLFAHIKQCAVGFRANLLMIFRVFLGCLLIIPGIVMSYSYAMIDYVLAENPDMNAREALAESRRIMRGNRWKLFCLQLSFIGPMLLCILTLGIGLFWFVPYESATIAVFYEEAKKNAY